MMLEIKPLVCPQCGASINRATMQCDYCGTQYERENEFATINYVVEHPNIHKITAKVSVLDELCCRSPDAASEFALRKMREQVADSLISYMRICTEKDYVSQCQIIQGEIRVVDPTFMNY